MRVTGGIGCEISCDNVVVVVVDECSEASSSWVSVQDKTIVKFEMRSLLVFVGVFCAFFFFFGLSTFFFGHVDLHIQMEVEQFDTMD